MTAAQKKAFVSRMAKARAASKKKTRRPAAGKRKTAAPVKRSRRAPKKQTRRTAHRRRLNPEQMAEAAAMYERFHGTDPNRIIDYDHEHTYRAELAELGRLIELRFQLEGETRPVPLDSFGACQVCCTPDGLNIYFVGGNQTVDLSALAIESDKDYIELGPCTYIKYHTKKSFHEFSPIDYYHSFGEEDGIKPLLMYDSQNKALFLAGGNYTVRPEGIVN